MQNLTRFLIPVLGGVGVLLTLLTILDFDGKICSSCWPVDFTLYFTYLLFALSAIAALIGAVVGTLSKPGALNSSMVGVGGMLLIVLVSYFLASDEVMPYYKETISVTEIKWSGTGIIMLYFLFAGAIGSVVFSSVYSIIKK